MNPNAMQLNSLRIERNMYKFANNNIPPNGIAGKISFSTGEGHEMTLVLTQEQIQQILNIVADAMVQTTCDLAAGLTRTIIESTIPTIEHQA